MYFYVCYRMVATVFMTISVCIVWQGLNCLHMAICEGHIGIVKELLASSVCELTRVEVSVLRARQCM